jgi:protein RhuM
MRDWVLKLRLILTLNEKNILEHAGTISYELAVEKLQKNTSLIKNNSEE